MPQGFVYLGGSAGPRHSSTFAAQVPIVRPLAGFARPMQIIWLGQVHNIGIHGQRRPQIEVVLRSAQNAEATTIRRQVPAAFVRALRLGDVWHGPNLVGQSSSPIVQLKDLEVSGDPSRVQPIGKPLNGAKERYPLDFRSFSDHSGHTGAYAVREDLGNGQALIVPCWELLRFYFGASGALVSRLLSGPLTARALYSSARYDPERDVHWLDLARGMHWTGAVTIARIALAQRAASAARWISNSGTAALVNGEPYYPKTNFPFAGVTNLTVQGRWLGPEREVLFVERIVSCSHPFPFRTLHYSVPDGSVKTARYPVCSSSCTSKTTSARVEIREGARGPSNICPVIHLPEHTDVAFPDLTQKLMRRVRTRTGFARAMPSHGILDNAVLVDGSETSAEGFAEVELASQDEVRNDETIQAEVADVFHIAINMLKNEGLAVQLKSLSGATGTSALVPLSEIVSASGVWGRAFACGAIRLSGQGGGTAYCLVRTGAPELSIDTHILLLRPERNVSTYAALLQAVEVLESGLSGGKRVIAAPESVALNAIAVARLIRSVFG